MSWLSHYDLDDPPANFVQDVGITLIPSLLRRRHPKIAVANLLANKL